MDRETVEGGLRETRRQPRVCSTIVEESWAIVIINNFFSAVFQKKMQQNLRENVEKLQRNLLHSHIPSPLWTRDRKTEPELSGWGSNPIHQRSDCVRMEVLQVESYWQVFLAASVELCGAGLTLQQDNSALAAWWHNCVLEWKSIRFNPPTVWNIKEQT